MSMTGSENPWANRMSPMSCMSWKGGASTALCSFRVSGPRVVNKSRPPGVKILCKSFIVAWISCWCKNKFENMKSVLLSWCCWGSFVVWISDFGYRVFRSFLKLVLLPLSSRMVFGSMLM